MLSMIIFSIFRILLYKNALMVEVLPNKSEKSVFICTEISVFFDNSSQIILCV